MQEIIDNIPLTEKEIKIRDLLIEHGIESELLNFKSGSGSEGRIMQYDYWKRLPVQVLKSINADEIFEEDCFYEEDCGWLYVYHII